MSRPGREVVEVVDGVPVPERVVVGRPVERRRDGGAAQPQVIYVQAPAAPPAEPVRRESRVWQVLVALMAVCAAGGVLWWAAHVGGPPWQDPASPGQGQGQQVERGGSR